MKKINLKNKFLLQIINNNINKNGSNNGSNDNDNKR